MEKSIIPSLIFNIFDEAKRSYSENEEVTENVLLSLYGVFDKVLNNALELIEAKAITVMHLDSHIGNADQFVFQVMGSSGSSYVLFYQINYCQCKFYLEKVLHSRRYPACKHFVAAHLGYIWGKYRELDIDFGFYKDLIKDINPSAS